MQKLTIFFSGSDMAWEDTAEFFQLGNKKRHNLRDKDAVHYYYFFDGPAATSSPEHPPVEKITFDAKSVDLLKSEPRSKLYSSMSHFYDLGIGSGMNNILDASYDLINLGIKKGIREFDLVGFSRGGSIILTLGAYLKKLERTLPDEIIKQLKFNIYAVDPVAGLANNQCAGQYGEMSHLVKKCVIGLATNESLPGFKPRDIISDDDDYNIKPHRSTQYVVLPFPDDHLMCNFWMQDIIKQNIPHGSDLLNPCDDDYLIERRLGLKEVKWHEDGSTPAFRMIKYAKNKQKYQRPILPIDQDIHMEHGIEIFFKYIESQKSKVNIHHVSLQNDADAENKDRYFSKDALKKPIKGAHPEFKLAQHWNAKRNQNKLFRALGAKDRSVKEKLSLYTNSIFVNLLHESIFEKQYPYIHQFLQSWDVKLLDQAVAEFERISAVDFPYTKINIAKAFRYGIKLQPIYHLKSTNAKDLTQILDVTINKTMPGNKEYKITSAIPASNIQSYIFAHVLVNASEHDAQDLYKRYGKKYFPNQYTLSILEEIYQRHHKILPKDFIERPVQVRSSPLSSDLWKNSSVLQNVLVSPINLISMRINKAR